jgi:hypothetical protein
MTARLNFPQLRTLKNHIKKINNCIGTYVTREYTIMLSRHKKKLHVTHVASYCIQTANSTSLCFTRKRPK